MFSTSILEVPDSIEGNQEHGDPATSGVRQLLNALAQEPKSFVDDCRPGGTLKAVDSVDSPSSLVEGIDVAAAVRWISKGPPIIRIDNDDIRWAKACPPADPQGGGGSGGTQITLEPVGQEDHLIDAERSRLRAEQNAEVADIGPGALVLAESCRIETVLMAGPEAFVVQLQLDLGDSDHEGKS